MSRTHYFMFFLGLIISMPLHLHAAVGIPTTACTSADALLSNENISAGTDLRCNAENSVTLGTDLVIGDAGRLQVVSSQVGMTPGFSVDTGGELSIRVADPPGPLCPASIPAGSEYECRVPALPGNTGFALDNAPLGMVIQPRSGYLHWTPLWNQQGEHAVEIIRNAGAQENRSTVTFSVTPSGATPASGIYVSPLGDDGNTGTAENPVFSLNEAAGRAVAGDTIYLRGGNYFNDGFGTDFNGRRNNLARITNSGTDANWITIRPHGNEYAKLISDVNGIVFSDAEYWRVQNLELQGSAQSLSREISLALWWDVSDQANRITGRGIAMNGAFNIDIRDCVIHDFPGAGLSNNNGAYITVADNIIYDNASWSTSGTHGFANSKPATRDNEDTTSVKIRMQRNLVFANQSSMISHVFSKGEVKLEVDEGNGLHMQNNAGEFFGRYRVEDNLSVYNGKAGLGLNTVDGGVIRDNAFYQNAQAVSGSAELSIQSSASDSIARNLFHAQPARETIKDFQDAYIGVGTNYAVPSLNNDQMPASVEQLPAVFVNPARNNFNPLADVPTTAGVPPATLAVFAAKAEEFGLEPQATSTIVDDDYVRGLRAEILPAWPAPDPASEIPVDLILEDPETGFCYAYADRNDYPNAPSSGTVCE